MHDPKLGIFLLRINCAICLIRRVCLASAFVHRPEFTFYPTYLSLLGLCRYNLPLVSRGGRRTTEQRSRSVWSTTDGLSLGCPAESHPDGSDLTSPEELLPAGPVLASP